MKGILTGFATLAAAAAVLLVGVVPAAAAVTVPKAPIVSVANPSPGDYLHRGQNWIAGVACDPDAATSDTTAGIAKVSVFVGDRDTGIGVPWYRPGGYFGAATLSGTNQEFSFNSGEFSRLGIPNPDVSVCKHPLSAWRVLPSSFRKGTIELNIYVLAKNGRETKVTIPGIRIDKP